MLSQSVWFQKGIESFMNPEQIEALVKQVLAQMSSGSSASTSGSSAAVPATAKIAMLTGERKIEVKEVPIPEVGDDEILIKVEGCGVCAEICSYPSFFATEAK